MPKRGPPNQTLPLKNHCFWLHGPRGEIPCEGGIRALAKDTLAMVLGIKQKKGRVSRESAIDHTVPLAAKPIQGLVIPQSCPCLAFQLGKGPATNSFIL